MKNMSNMGNANNIVYWYKNQVIITHYSKLSTGASTAEIIQAVLQSQDQINNQILKDTPYKLQLVGKNPMPQPGQSAAMMLANDPNDLDGIFVFPTSAPGTLDRPTEVIATFYTIEPRNAETMSSMTAMQGRQEAGGMLQSDEAPDHTLTVIDHLHKHLSVNQPSFDAMPHWFWSGTDDQIHGCPTCPPIPIEDKGTSGYWKMTFGPLSDTSLQGKTGAGVSVFILDTMPSSDQLSQAKTAGKNNILFQSMIAAMKSNAPFDAIAPAININYFDVPDQMHTAKTGKDIYGRLVGFPMSDHGLTVAGIVRDLAPDAQIECIRVLNDYGVGDTNMLYQALRYIEKRMKDTNDLYRKPIVINLSLVVVPPKPDWARFHWDKHPEKPQRMLRGLAARMESMARDGVIFVAAAGNDSDPRDPMMNPLEVRFGPRYPAAFRYDNPGVTTMIPVGAVNQKGEATTYSNHPDKEGIGAYGGELPKPDPWMPSAMAHVVTHLDPNTPIDAICGVYSSSTYPALSRNDHIPTSPMETQQPMQPTEYPEYSVSQPSTWAYWSGTSFATPIISALAARMLQGQQRIPGGTFIDVRKAAAQQTMWTGLETGDDVSGPIIIVSQEWNDVAS